MNMHGVSIFTHVQPLLAHHIVRRVTGEPRWRNKSNRLQRERRESRQAARNASRCCRVIQREKLALFRCTTNGAELVAPSARQSNLIVPFTV